MEQKLIIEQKLDEEQELITKFKYINNKQLGTLELFNILTQLVVLRNNRNEDVTQRTLARLLGTNQRKIGRLLAWRYATDFMKECVETNKVRIIKAMYILLELKLFDLEESKANKTFETAMGKKTKDIDKIGKSFLLDTEPVNQYASVFNIVRGIERSCNHIRLTLLSFDKIPPNDKLKLKSILKKHKEIINCYWNKLQKNQKA